MDRRLWNQIVKENMDISDRRTLKCMTSINEADQDQVVASLAARIYDSIIKKVPEIDYGTIPLSKGDITKIDNYFDICKCLTDIRDMLIQKKQSTADVDIIFSSIEYMKRLKNLWVKGFAVESEMVVVTYNTITLSIVAASSIMLQAMIEFIKDPTTGEFEMCLSRVKKQNSKDSILLSNLDKFNKAAAKGDIEKSLEAMCKAQRQLKESSVDVVTEGILSIVASGAALIAIATCLIPILHQLTSALLHLRQSLSDYFEVESNIIRMNAEKVKYSTAKSEESKKKIIAKQKKIADVFKAISNKLAIKSSKAEAEAKKEIAADNSKKYKVDELMDEIPDSADLF